MLARAGEPITGSHRPFEGISEDISRSSLFFVNLESPLGNSIESHSDMNLCADVQASGTLAENGVDLASLANNHRDDCLLGGDSQTAENLKMVGVKSALADMQPVYLDEANDTIAVIAVDDVSTAVDENLLLTRIEQASSLASITIVSMHWGNEYQAGPDERQTRLAQAMADAGADIIWGHHPHVLQRMAWLKRADGNDALVLYSLGNLVADQWMLPDANRSALVKLFFKKGELVQIEIIPVLIQSPGVEPVRASEGSTRDAILERLQVDRLSIGGVEIVIQ